MTPTSAAARSASFFLGASAGRAQEEFSWLAGKGNDSQRDDTRVSNGRVNHGRQRRLPPNGFFYRFTGCGRGTDMKSKWLTTISVTALALGASAGTTLAAGMDDLVAAAKKEGQLTTIALPHDWCGYGARDRRLQGEIRPRRSTSSTPTPAPATRSRRSRPTRTTRARRRPT